MGLSVRKLEHRLRRSGYSAIDSERGQPSIRVRLYVRNFGEDPNVVTRILGLTPSFAGKRGDRGMMSNGLRSKRTLVEPQWFIRGRISEQAPMIEHLREIANITATCQSFDQLPPNTQVDVVASITWGYSNPSFAICADSMAELARIGASLAYSRLTHKRGVRWL